MQNISATEMARNFSVVLNRVACGREQIEVRRGGKPVAVVSPVVESANRMADTVTLKELANVLASLPALGSDAVAFSQDINEAQPAQQLEDAWQD